SIADEAADASPTVEHVVVWRRFGDDDTPWNPARDVEWPEQSGGMFETRALDPETPLMLAYTSGTTGRPKGSVHVHGGFLVKIASETAYQTDLHPDETLYWVTDMGWIMGPWEMVGAGCAGATVVLYEGAPDWPQPDRVWASVEQHGVNVLGVSPTL